LYTGIEVAWACKEMVPEGWCSGDNQIREELWDCDNDNIADITCRSPLNHTPIESGFLSSSHGLACYENRTEITPGNLTEKCSAGFVNLSAPAAARLSDNPPIRNLVRADDCNKTMPGFQDVCERTGRVALAKEQKTQKWDCAVGPEVWQISEVANF
jgi:hypothetical protein